MVLSERVNTYGQYLLHRYGERVHKIALDAGFTCPNIDGTKGWGGCTFCNNASFSPTAGKQQSDIVAQIKKAREVIARRTGAKRFIAYFQAYTNTYDDIEALESMYRLALAQPGVIGISVGTRPDCVSEDVLELLAGFRRQGMEICLELGLQSAFDHTLVRVNRGHTLAEYRQTAIAARRLGIPLCTHLIVGLPGESDEHWHTSLDVVLEIGTDGLKLHPLHVVKQTVLAHQWRQGGYQPLSKVDYLQIAADLIERTPPHIVFHRVTATASPDILLAPSWCSEKWNVLNGIEQELRRRGARQGNRAGIPYQREEIKDVA
ncbi:tRNA-2-methylthio-N(6)-dimethylallyladenosine synthase [Novimethylophilus kurashikiensis]|uniref:tRNA-2-methylthio-N(6)-dimethylallyladenosine synthase n=1 Tax=Novimethylophilus kurashikiensis TaxID=1825523 RepID=A0A2R5FEU6_9PROT|nr:TIGR01212 family radical SAM protein [Novimethylophilus kurashikiensis]GBG14924.1 tRNA-2-methylthio-N(6)-dimethylallyladenosine synthase [Novimethylophilus kurashikiensis]